MAGNNFDYEGAYGGAQLGLSLGKMLRGDMSGAEQSMSQGAGAFINKQKREREGKAETARQQALQKQNQFDNSLKLMSTVKSFADQGYDPGPVAGYLEKQQRGEAAGLEGIFQKKPQAQGPQIDQQIKQAQLRKINQDIALKGKAFEQKKQVAGMQLSPGEKKVDEAFAKDFNSFIVQGGIADAQKGIAQLEEASAELGKSDDITGPVIGTLPNFVTKRIFPKSASVKQSIEEVVQRNLRTILGAQFTEKEGTRLIERAFDPALSEQENKKRVDRLLESMKSAVDAKVAAADYFKKNGTLKGFEGKTNFTLKDFEQVVAQPDNQQALPPGLQPIQSPMAPAQSNQYNIFGQALPAANAQQIPMQRPMDPNARKARIQELMNK